MAVLKILRNFKRGLECTAETKEQYGKCTPCISERKCTTLNKYDAFNLRNYVNKEEGVVWWFTAI